MTERVDNPAAHSFPGRLSWLLVSILALLLLRPFLPAEGIFEALLELFVTAILVAAFFSVSGGPWTRNIGLAFMLLALAANWAERVFPLASFLDVRYALVTVFLFYVAAVILLHVLRVERITAEQVSGVGSVYLLIGVGWGYLYFVLEALQPGSLSNLSPERDEGRLLASCFYYSFVTLTTLGYGDVSPLSPQARALAITEAVVGQLYLVVIVARIVALQITHRNR